MLHANPFPLQVALASGIEVSAMAIIVFSILPHLQSIVAIFVLSGVFSIQVLWNCLRRSKHKQVTGMAKETATKTAMKTKTETVTWKKGCYILLQVIQIAFGFLQLVVLAVFAAIQCEINVQVFIGCGTFLSLLALVVVWSTNCKVQQESNLPSEKKLIEIANFKANFISAVLRIILYPFISYIIFRYAFTNGSIDPWCLNLTCSLSKSFQWKGQELAIFLIQILSSLFGYTFMWISCTMVLHCWGLVLPLYLCTPISLLVCGLVQDFSVFHFSKLYINQQELKVLIVIGFCILLWILQILMMSKFIWRRENLVLAKDVDMFLAPRYDGVFLEQHMILNRLINPASVSINSKPRPKTIFICSTMYQEDREEMKQLLYSIFQLALHCKENKYDHFESHIFLDGGANGTQMTYFALQLFSLFTLFKEMDQFKTLQFEPEMFQRINTPYGIQLRWEIVDAMPIHVHLKDSTKIKNKKRWSQVMYMNYVLNFRIKKNIHRLDSWREQERHQRRTILVTGIDGKFTESATYEYDTEFIHADDPGCRQTHPKMDYDNTCILTTDADIQFTPESVTVLLDILDSDPQVGAVCGRTHPKGSGPLYWYQIFEYAIGHWLLKVAEHVLGTVLCCPGCFSVFRCSALRSVLDTYSTEVTSASEFLTKDMGEDRWLCTLLVENGWKLEYCPTSENYTHCPESFDEFFKQRKRWIPSTIANLSLLITQASKVTKKNVHVSLLFVIFEGILVFSTAISPATVILVIASGIVSAFNVSDSFIVAIIIILSLLSIAYGIFCLYGNPQHQLDVAKSATFVFAIIMSVVFAGNIKTVIYDFVETYEPCTRNAMLSMSTCQNRTGYLFPLTPSNLYLIIFTLLFICSGLFHLKEFHCLIHGVWYFIALPSGYLILLIYSVANLNSTSWGTREKSNGSLQDNGFKQIKDILLTAWQKVLFCFSRDARKQTAEEASSGHSAEKAELVDEDAFKLTDELQTWLTNKELPPDYAAVLEHHGYFDLTFIAGLKVEDCHAMGLNNRGYVLRLVQYAKKLPPFIFKISQPSLELSDVKTWLNSLQLQGYQELFEEAGYKTRDDLENLKGIDLTKMGITKKAHIERLLGGINKLTYLTEEEKMVYETRRKLVEKENMLDTNSNHENLYWTGLLGEGKPLRPLAAKPDHKLEKELKSLRNITLAFLLVINAMWVVLLYTLQFPELQKFNLPTKAFELFYLAVYTFIVSVQFSALVIHRGITFIHYLASVGSTGDNIRTLLCYEEKK
ncbi:hypothetical protein EMCRGX_G012737 [Ephydatia muelleri]